MDFQIKINIVPLLSEAGFDADIQSRLTFITQSRLVVSVVTLPLTLSSDQVCARLSLVLVTLHPAV